MTLALAGCTVPRLDGVYPDEVRPGATVTLRGAALELADGPVLRGADGSEVELPWTGAGPATRTLNVPGELTTGAWVVGLRSQGWLAPEGTATLNVWRPEDEPPCRRRYSLQVTTERLKHRLVVQRSYPDGEDDTQEVTVIGGESGFGVRVRGDAACAELHLIRPDGSELLLADGTERTLLVQGRALADSFEVTFVDAREAAAP